MDRSSQQLLEEVNKLIFVKKYAEAESLIWEIVEDERYSNRDLGHLRLIELSVKLGTIPALKEVYEDKLKASPNDPFLLTALVLAEQHAELISPIEAAARFGELLKEHGGSASIYYGIGFCMEATGNFDRALYNYEQCINQDTGFYPGYFGLSQVYYQMNDDAKGDYYFHIFEENAPYNVYGNFETHRSLSNEFLEAERFKDAQLAITALSEWWVDNKGMCPPEVQIYEEFSIARIYEYEGKGEEAAQKRARAVVSVRRLLTEQNVDVGILYFVAKTLEEFSEFELALEYYQSILTREGVSNEMIQKIGGQFLSLGEYELSLSLFDKAYKYQPDNAEVRFCLLVAKLRLAQVDVEDYLLQRERMKQLVSSGGDRVELLSVLHNLSAKFDRDPDVHKHLGDVYLKLENIDRAGQHFKKMFELDSLSLKTALCYAGFEAQYGSLDAASEILTRIENEENLSGSDKNEVYWLKATLCLKQEDFDQCRRYLAKALKADPWNISYLVYDAICLVKMAPIASEKKEVDAALEHLASNEDSQVNWEAFAKTTESLGELHQYELAYIRDKIHFLYAEKDDQVLMRLVRRAGLFDAQRGTYDFLRLLNTNFDGPEIYWALGMLFKENWQLESASMWFDQILLLPEENTVYRAKAFLELADCYIWRDQNFEKAIEYVKIAMSLGERGQGKALTIMAHALLRLGQVKQAELYLDDAEFNKDHEAAYLKGLLHYRNGLQMEANTIWKPLLTVRSDSLRFHNIKQEIMKYYFEKAPYLGAN